MYLGSHRVRAHYIARTSSMWHFSAFLHVMVFVLFQPGGAGRREVELEQFVMNTEGFQHLRGRISKERVQPLGPRVEAVVLRTTSAHHSQERWKRWAVYAKQLAAQGIPVWVSVDVTIGHLKETCQRDWSDVPSVGNCIFVRSGDEEGFGRSPKMDDSSVWLGVPCQDEGQLFEQHPGLKDVLEIFEAIPGVGLHVYSEKDMVAGFPTLKELWDYKQMYQHPLGWGYGPQATGLLWRRLKEMEGDAMPYHSMWVFQDDTVFGTAGNADGSDLNVQPLLDRMVANAENPPGVQALDVKNVVKGTWMWWDTGSTKFSEAMKDQPRYFSSERGQRLSAELLDEMDKWCRELGRCGWGEMFVGMVAKASNMDWSKLKGDSPVQEGGGNAGAGYCKDSGAPEGAKGASGALSLS